MPSRPPKPRHRRLWVALIVAVVTVAAAMYLASTVVCDSFHGDTRNGRLSVSVSRVIAGDEDRIVRLDMRWSGDQPVAVRKLAATAARSGAAGAGTAVVRRRAARRMALDPPTIYIVIRQR